MKRFNLTIFKIGDLVKLRQIPPWVTDLPARPGIVVHIYHEGGANEALKVVFADAKTIVRPYDEWNLL